MTVQSGHQSTSFAEAWETAGCESAKQIINIAATAEAFAVTALGAALENVEKGLLKLNATEFKTFTAARAEEQAHYLYLTGAGAKPLTTTFTVPNPKIVTDVTTFLTTVIHLEELFIAAYLAAAQEFALLKQSRLAQVAIQIGGVEAEHRAGARFFAVVRGIIGGIPNDVAFEKAMFTHVEEAQDALEQLGIIGGKGTPIHYPGPGAIDFHGVNHLRP